MTIISGFFNGVGKALPFVGGIFLFGAVVYFTVLSPSPRPSQIKSVSTIDPWSASLPINGSSPQDVVSNQQTFALTCLDKEGNKIFSEAMRYNDWQIQRNVLSIFSGERKGDIYTCNTVTIQRQ